MDARGREHEPAKPNAAFKPYEEDSFNFACFLFDIWPEGSRYAVPAGFYR